MELEGKNRITQFLEKEGVICFQSRDMYACASRVSRAVSLLCLLCPIKIENYVEQTLRHLHKSTYWIDGCVSNPSSRADIREALPRRVSTCARAPPLSNRSTLPLDRRVSRTIPCPYEASTEGWVEILVEICVEIKLYASTMIFFGKKMNEEYFTREIKIR